MFDVGSAVAAAVVCDASVAKIIGAGTERQFAFQGIVAEEKPLRDWIQEILGSCLGYYTLAFGKLKLGLHYNSSSIEAFSLGNILFNSLQLASRSPRFNDLTVAFPDKDYGYQQYTINWKDSDHIAATGLDVADRPADTPSQDVAHTFCASMPTLTATADLNQSPQQLRHTLHSLLLQPVFAMTVPCGERRRHPND